MSDNITTEYNEEINAIIVRMPDEITLNLLKQWQNDFLILLKTRKLRKSLSLLLDVNKHNFESIECLKLLREFLSQNVVVNQNISKIAFVTPKKFRKPGTRTSKEGYFESFDEASIWLKSFEITLQYLVRFDDLDWQSPMEGLKHKYLDQNNLRIRLVEYSKNMAPHWCEKGHYGCIVDGEFKIEYENETIVYKKGDGIFIPDGPKHKHKGTVLSEKAIVFFIEHI